MKKIYTATICAAIAIFTIFWSLGDATDLFAQPAFSAFWWLSYESAHYAEFVALSIGGALLLLFVNYWTLHKEKK